MSAAALGLRAAIHARLAGDPALSALLGGPRIYDEPPRALTPPYVVLAAARVRTFPATPRRRRSMR